MVTAMPIYCPCFLASIFLLNDSGISGGGGRGNLKNTLTESYMNHCRAVSVPTIMILVPRPFHNPVAK